MARSVFALCPYLGTYGLISRGLLITNFPIIYNSHDRSLEVSSLKIIILWWYGIPGTTHYKERKL